MFKKNFIKFFAIVISISLPFSVFAQEVNPNFNPTKLIEDTVFSDTQTFGGPEGVQKFLESKNSVLANQSGEFLVKLKEPQVPGLKTGLEDPQPNLGRLRTAAELIWDASRQSGLNPQVIIVTLNKEQGLITSANGFSESKLQKALDRSMGFDCPDGGGCGSLFPGFYYQLFGNFDAEGNRYLGAAKSLMKSFTTVGGRGPIVGGRTTKVGETIVLENTLGGYQNVLPSQSVWLSNSATTALYRYTPHVFNGNYNFWRFFQEWFKYPNGTLFKLGSSGDVYIVQNGLKALVPQFVALSRSLNLNSTITVSPNEYESYTTDKPLGPQNNTVVQVAGETSKFVFIDNVRHQASDLVIRQRGLSPNNILSITPVEAAIFEAGSILPPNDGTIIRGNINQAVYLVEAGKIKMFSAYTFAQNKITKASIVTVPDEEILTYTQNGFVAPKDGSLVKSASDTTVYFVESGLKKPMLGEIFKNRGLSFKNVATISQDELTALPMGTLATPKEKTYFAADSKKGSLYVFTDGAVHSISAYVAKQRGITPDYVFDSLAINNWIVGIPIPPRDNTIVKGDSDNTVYLVVKGQLRPMTLQAYNNRKITPKRIVVLPQLEVDAYAKGEILEK